MPELPDIESYLGALRSLVAGSRLRGVRLSSPFLLRSVEPPLSKTAGRSVLGVTRLGKRVVLALEDDLFLVLHLMIAGRLHWKAPGAKIPGRVGLAAFDFDPGTLVLTEAGSKKRASLYAVAGEEALAEHDPGGLEVLDTDLETFASAVRSRSHTLKRALTDPRILAGIGNAYSDEILHRACLSPFKRTRDLGEDEVARLFEATRAVLNEWTARLTEEARRNRDGFPAKVTAFRPEMAVHGKHREPCPACGSPVQRIVYASNEANYCASCQTGGKILADRVLSKLLKDDWPRTLEELEERRL
ncbi:MAG: formamidopyrimidine-DNA glycosylase [bacterium]|nr:formamidopyrimidine-DNA glycosylase [bacterium]